jgi:hypothetical protein
MGVGWVCPFQHVSLRKAKEAMRVHTMSHIWPNPIYHTNTSYYPMLCLISLLFIGENFPIVEKKLKEKVIKGFSVT